MGVTAFFVAFASTCAALTAGSAALLFFTSYIYYCLGVYRYRHVPGPSPSFPWGNADLLKTRAGDRRPLPEVHAELHEKYGDVVVFFIACTPVVVISGRHAVDEVTRTNFLRMPSRNVTATALSSFGRRALLAGILFCKPGLWATIRGVLAQLNSPPNVRRLRQGTAEAASALATAATAAPGLAINLHTLFSEYSLASLFPFVFGAQLPRAAPSRTNLTQAISTLFQSLSFSGPLASLQFLFPEALRSFVTNAYVAVDPLASSANAATNVIVAATQQMAEAYLARHPELSYQGDMAGFSVLKDPPLPAATEPDEWSLVSALMHSMHEEYKRPLSPTEFLGQVLNVIISGHTVVASSLSASVFYISGDPEVEEKLCSEIDRHPNELPTLDNGKEWPYTNAVVAETLRIVPPYPVVTRKARLPVSIAGVSLPSGTTVHASYQSILHNTSEFPQPLEFRPSRWLRSSGSGGKTVCETNSSAFGIGCRFCPAERFTTQQLLIALVAIYRKHKFSLSPTHHADRLLNNTYQVAQTPRDGLWALPEERIVASPPLQPQKSAWRFKP